MYEVKEVNNRQDYCEKKQMQGQNNTKTNTKGKKTAIDSPPENCIPKKKNLM